MKEFFNRIAEILKNVKTFETHQKVLFIITFVAATLIGFICGYFMTVLLSLLVGLLVELTYCYVPFKETTFFGMTFNLPDFKRFRAEASDGALSRYYDFNRNNGYYCYASVFLYVVIRLIFSFF